MSYTVKIGFTGGDRVFSVLKGTIETYVGAQGKHATQSTPVKVQSATCAALLLTETASVIPATIYHNSTVIFEGYIRPYRSVGAKNATEDPVSLQVMDSTEYMHRVTGTDVVYSNKTVAQLVELVYAASGATPTLGPIPAELSSFSVDRLRVSSEEYWDEVLAELLYEYGYDYLFVPGCCQIQKTTIDAAPNQSITDIRNNYKVQKNDNTIDGTIVDYKKAAYRENVRLYSDDTRYDATKTGMFGTRKTGNYYNGLMHNDQVTPPAGNLVYWDFPGTGIGDLNPSNVLSVDNVRFDFFLEDEDGITLTENFDTSGSDLLTGARWWLHYDGTFNRVFGVGWGWIVRAYGNVLYLVDGNWQYRCEGLDPKKYSAKYISNENAAKAMAEREYKRFKVCHTKYSFDSLTSYNVGEFYNLEETTVGVDTVVRILGKSLSSDGIYTYQCEGADIIGLSVSVEELQVRDIDAAGGMLNLTLSTDTISFPTDNVTATLSGYVTGQNHIAYKWYINETLSAVGQQTRVFNQTAFSNGKNTIKAEVWHTAEDASDHDVLLASVEAELENLGNPIVETIPEYYHSASISILIPNVFVVTPDTTKQSGKVYYEKEFTPDSGYVPTEDSSLISGKTYYEDASWLEEIIDHTGSGYYVNGHLVPTQDTTKQSGKTYYYYYNGSYVVFTGSTFVSGTTYYEFVEYPSYVWHRQKYVYSNGDVSYSAYAYYLTTADVANPFTITTFFEVATSGNWIITQDSVAIEGKTYYVLTANGKYEQVGMTAGSSFPVGVTILEIPNFEWIVTEDQTPDQTKKYYKINSNNLYEEVNVSGGSFPVGVTIYELVMLGDWMLDAIPSTWRSGLKVWLKEVLTYENQPDNPINQNPRYSALHTQDMESSCVFEVELDSYTWNKDMRSTQSDTPVTIHVNSKIIGYGNSTPIISVSPSTGVTISNDSFTFYSNIEVDALSVAVSLSGYPNVPVQVFTVNSVDVTEEPAYLGMLPALPTPQNTRFSVFLIGDHFVASQTFTDTGVQYDKLMPYVLTANGWDRPQNGQLYNGISTNQVLYDSARDIFTNADWVYNGPLPSGSTAQAGVNYYSESAGTYSPVAVPTGDSVQGLYTRQRDLPSEVANYYNYQESMLATYIGANDIELVKDGDKIGSVRSASYSRGTVAEMNRIGSDAGFEKGFYLGGDGQFEAYKAELYKADMFEATVHGKLDAATLQTETSPQTGTAVDDNDITQGTKYWDVAEAIQTIRGVSGWEDNKVKDLSTTLSGTQRTKAMYVSNPSATGSSGTKAGGATFTMPIQAVANITGKFYDSNGNEVVSGSIVNGGTVLTNKARWNISDLYNNGSISANSVLSASGSWKSYSISWLAKVTNVSNTAFLANTSGTCPNNYNTDDDVTVYTVPSWVKTSVSVTISGVSKYVYGVLTWGAQRRTQWSWGNVEVYVNSSKKYTSYGGYETESQSSFEQYAYWSTTQTVKGGDVIRIYYNARNQYKTIASVYSYSYGTWNISGSSSFTSQGMSSNGLWVFYSSSWHNLGTDTEYLQNSNYISLSSPVTWSSSSNVYTASLTYDYSLYSAGLNLLNATTSASEAVLNTGITSTVFSASYGGTVCVNSANGTGVTLLYKYRGLTQASGSVFSVSSSRFSFTRGDGTSLPQVTNVIAVTWDSSSITVSLASGAVFSFSQSASSNKADYLSAFDLYFVPMARALGNYTKTIIPMDNETDRTEEINLGSLGNRFDAIYSKELGARTTPVEDIYSTNGMIKNVNLIPVTVSSFASGVTYYYFSSGVLTAETAGSPVSGRQYFLLNTGGYGHFDVLSMLDSATSQRKRIDELYIKLSAIEQSLSSSSTMIPSSKAVNDAIMNINSTVSAIPFKAYYDLSDNANLNNCRESTVIYYCDETSTINTFSNKPSAAPVGEMALVYLHLGSAAYSMQFYFAKNGTTSGIYSRVYNNGSWSSWRAVLSSG